MWDANEHSEQCASADLTLAQLEEVLAVVEDESDRRAAEEFNREAMADLAEFDDDQLIEQQKQQMSEMEEQLASLDNQVGVRAPSVIRKSASSHVSASTHRAIRSPLCGDQSRGDANPPIEPLHSRKQSVVCGLA